jgi:hypothetical protein
MSAQGAVLDTGQSAAGKRVCKVPPVMLVLFFCFVTRSCYVAHAGLYPPSSASGLAGIAGMYHDTQHSLCCNLRPSQMPGWMASLSPSFPPTPAICPPCPHVARIVSLSVSWENRPGADHLNKQALSAKVLKKEKQSKLGGHAKPWLQKGN